MQMTKNVCKMLESKEIIGKNASVRMDFFCEINTVLRIFQTFFNYLLGFPSFFPKRNNRKFIHFKSKNCLRA